MSSDKVFGRSLLPETILHRTNHEFFLLCHINNLLETSVFRIQFKRLDSPKPIK